MSYHPESEPNFSERIECPRCHSDDIEWADLISEEFGIAAFFNVWRAKCLECEHEFKLITIVDEHEFGVADFNESSYNRKPAKRIKVNRDGTASIRSLQEIQSKRSPSAIKADARVRAKNTVHTRDYKGNYRPVSLKDGKKWAKNPGSMDIVGVDAPYSKTQQRRNPKGQFISAKKRPNNKRK